MSKFSNPIAKRDPAAAAAFIGGAPDGAKEVVAPVVTVARKAKVEAKAPLSLTMKPSLVARITELAAAQGMSRAEAFEEAIVEWIAKHGPNEGV
ncbi:hypothetical protein CBA19CS91_39790 [Paraburkholderia hospita]|nr:hypothetical protein CBA19CS91_39790 [Paraburkholderia hospita]